MEAFNLYLNAAFIENKVLNLERKHEKHLLASDRNCLDVNFNNNQKF